MLFARMPKGVYLPDIFGTYHGSYVVMRHSDGYVMKQMDEIDGIDKVVFFMTSFW